MGRYPTGSWMRGDHPFVLQSAPAVRFAAALTLRRYVMTGTENVGEHWTADWSMIY